MLAVHGGVCNVMKEVGIRAAYSALADSVEEAGNDPRNCVLHILYDLRELLVEKMYHAQELDDPVGAVQLNTHNLIAYRNPLARYVGLATIPDPDMTMNSTAATMVPHFFQRFYSVDIMIDAIAQALNEPPRRINYDAIIGFLKYNRPEEEFPDPEEFMWHLFDEEGNFTRGVVAWILYKMGCLKIDEKHEMEISNMFPPLDELELSRSQGYALERSGQAAVTSLENSMGREEVVEDLMTSQGLALSHSCAHCDEQ